MKSITVTLLTLIVCSCGGIAPDQKENSESIPVIDLLSEPGVKVEKLSEFASNVEYIPLQTTKGSLLGDVIRKVININNTLYIQNVDEILCFDTKGKFLFKLQKPGRGPEEYTYIDDFDVSSENKNLILLTLNKMMVYEITETGFSFQRSILLEDPPPIKISQVPGTGNVFLAIPPWIGNEQALSALINAEGNLIHFKPNCYKYKDGKLHFKASNESISYNLGDKICFKEEFSDTVFYVDGLHNSFKPRLILNSHGTLTTPAIRSGSETPGKNLNFLANIFETPRYVFYYFGNEEKRTRILFDTKTKTKYELASETGVKDDLFGGPDFNIEFFNSYCSGGKLFSFAQAISFKKYVAGKDFVDARRKNDLKKLADSLKETDNPVLIIVSPKE